MAREFRLQDPGEGIHEAEIVELDVSEGEQVEDGDVLLSVETDKATVEIPSPFTGTVEEIAVEVGQRVEVGDVLLTYTAEGEEAGAPAAEEPPTEEGAAEGEEVGEGGEAGEGDQPEADDEAAEGEGAGDEGAGDEEAGEEGADEAEGEAPAAVAEAREEEAARETASVPRSGDEGAPAPEGEPPEGELPHPRDRPVPASPATRRRARELEVDLHRVPGSGPGGRVTTEDVEAFTSEGPPAEAPAPEEEPAAGEPADGRPAEGELPDFSRWGPVERTPFRSVRRTTAERMARSWERIPHVTHMDVADVTELERLRREREDEVEEAGGRLTLTVLVMKAAVSALKEHPRFNASLDSDAGEIVLKRYYHMGLAVDTDRGLLVPVVRDVDRKSVVELAVEVADLVDRTRAGELAPEEMRGASFTITNPGPIGGTGFTPIIDWPQVAILGMGRARVEPVARGGLDDPEIEPRLRLPLCLGFDHRVNDGAGAARFVRHLTEVLSAPDAFVLRV